MKLCGTPYLGAHNQQRIKEALESEVSSIKLISLYELIRCAEEKNSVVVIDGKWLTWLEDIQLDYRHHLAYIPYFTYDVHWYEPYSRVSNYEYPHILRKENMMGIRWNFDIKLEPVNIGSSVIIYDINKKEKIEYSIDAWFNGTFSVDTLYKLYRKYCYYDMQSKFSVHEGGYTYITLEAGDFSNKERRLRKELGLKEFAHDSSCMELPKYRDVRMYSFFDYLGKCSDGQYVGDKPLKYRRLDFEAYLFCALREGVVPEDCAEWGLLGKKKYYIAINRDTIPMFIKHEWLNETSLKNTKTWRR